MISVLHIKETNVLMCGACGGEIRSSVRVVCCPVSNVAVAFQGIWSGDVKEKHRHCGRRLPSNTHHRVEGTFLRFSCPYQGDARHSKLITV